MNRINITVRNLAYILQNYDQIAVFRSGSEAGPYSEITIESTRITLEEEQTVYTFSDASGTATHWYKTAFYNSTSGTYSDKSAPILGGTELVKVGYSFGNYAAPPGEWGEILTPDDIRYTYMFGIDAVADDANRSEFTDDQYRFFINQAVSDFERFLTIDIRKKVYKTHPDPSMKRARYWIEGVDYTDEEDEYDFDPGHWNHYGFVQLRHKPVLSIERAVMYSPLRGEVLDLKEKNWLRLNKQFGQLNFYPTQGAQYGPYNIYGYPWQTLGIRFPQGFEFDYTTGWVTSDYVPDDLRGVIGMWATIKALDTIGDGLLAGFSSQSISLDGLSESFSSTQSATSAYFGARIKSYLEQIDKWLQRNRYKWGSIPIGFVGGA